MSKAFTSEETPDDPIVVPARAPLPHGVPNYVTPRGLALLRDERTALERERESLVAATGNDEHERQRRLAINGARLAAVASRIASARVVDVRGGSDDEPRGRPHDDVRFGATVMLRDPTGATTRYTIVGVDEAAPAEGRIAFLSPLARALIGLRIGDTATLATATGHHELTIESIGYDALQK